MKKVDLTGKKFGMLTVVEQAESRKGQTYWKCKCDCGRTVTVRSPDLRRGHTKSCGCKQLANANRAKTTHGKTRGRAHAKDRVPRIYNTWSNMKARCNNPNNPAYYRYGGRGIKVCREWENSFETFYQWAMAHGYTDELTIDRIDNDGGYSPENCQWVTLSENGKRQGPKRFKNQPVCRL